MEVQRHKKRKTPEETKPSKPMEAEAAAKPMEKQKKRKAMDKERRLHAALEAKPKPPPSMDDVSELKTAAAASSSGGAVLPEFHVGVFKDLASADAAVREAAVEALATELMEVQRAYEGLENKELLEGGGVKLEAEKDDGLNDCAPSLRYALRRLIRGVSSSREVLLFPHSFQVFRVFVLCLFCSSFRL